MEQLERENERREREEEYKRIQSANPKLLIASVVLNNVNEHSERLREQGQYMTQTFSGFDQPAKACHWLGIAPE